MYVLKSKRKGKSFVTYIISKITHTHIYTQTNACTHTTHMHMIHNDSSKILIVGCIVRKLCIHTFICTGNKRKKVHQSLGKI